MAQSKAQTVKEYLDELPDDRRKVVSKVRSVVKKSLPKGYTENVGFGMITYEVPLKDYPKTYNKKPLMYAAIAAQKNHYAVYLMCAYGVGEVENKLRKTYEAEGKKFDFGKSCLRFKNLDELSEKGLSEAIASTPPAKFIEAYEASRKGR